MILRRHHLHIAHRTLRYLIVGALLIAALLGVVASQLLPLVESHPADVAAFLSKRAGRPVAFDRVETRWTRLGPLLRLDNLRVGQGAQTVRIGDAEMLVSTYSGLLPGHAFTELRLRGLDLTIERAADGQWHVRGLPGQEQTTGDPLDALEGLGELQVSDGRLAIVAPGLGLDARVPRIDLRLRVDGPRVRAGLRAWMRTGHSPLDAVLDFDRRSGNGRAYAGALDADLATWTPLLQAAGVSATGGTGRVQAWATLRDHRIAAITADAGLDGLHLRGAPEVAGHPAEEATFDRVQLRTRFQRVVGGWRLDAPELRFGGRDNARVLDGLTIAGGQRIVLLADRIEAGPLFAVLALSDEVPAGLRDWLRTTHPQASLSRLRIVGRPGGPLYARGRVDGLGFATVGNAPGLSGLSGDFEGDAQGLRVVFDPKKPMRFDWPRGFGVVHTVTLHGEADAWREGAGWRVATPALRVRSADYGANVRGGMWFQNDGTRPWIDLAADIDATHVPVARNFWIRYLMAPAAVQWLDAALVGGRVEHGHAIVSGDLDDWPFVGNNGRFECLGRIADATLKFQPDWPAAEHVDADVSFIGDGFNVTGQGVLANVGIRRFDAGIAHYGHAALTVQAEGGGDASRLLGLLRASPLHKEYGDTLDNVSASGLAAVTFALDLPFHAGGTSTLGGTVALAGAKLADRRWNLAFDDVRGRANYGNGGFEAERLAVVHDSQPGRLSLRAGQYVRDPRQAFEADLDAALGAKALLAHAPDLGWLAPYLDGRSNWTASVAVARTPAGSTTAVPSRLQLRSNLVGTRLLLPAPLHKAAAALLPTTVDAALPLGSGEVRVALGNVMALRARSGTQTGVRVVMGSDSVADPAPTSGLIATGHATTLDALDWMTVARGSGHATGGSGLSLQHVDVGADHLHLLGGDFADTRLQVDPIAGGITVQLQGNALTGRLAVPDADAAPITGRFARVHWRDIPVAVADAGDAAAVGADINPAKVPPLVIDIDDLRLRNASLGTATLRTRQLPTGLRIEQLQARASKQQMAMQGDWTGVGAAARTRMSLSIDSQDYGALLGGFGYGGQLAGGHGRVTLDATWPGSPSTFALAGVDGVLHLDARDGQLTELEPGAGRVLGLLSIAQLPKRLTLDFRDLFSKGLAFDRMHGDVRIGGGHARSDNLAIDGPAADIRIRGAADLRAQEFDQTVDVYPKTGNLLTVAGAIAGGPVGAAIGAAANAMLQKPLGRLAAKTYHVTGPWKDPKVEVISREQSQVAAQRTDAGGG
jgi:uncharacterized protein (TIGR02099 family)